MRLPPASLIFAMLLVLPVAAPAAEKPVDPYVQSDSNAGVTPIPGDAVYKAFHGKAGIDRIVHRLIGYHHADPRISDLFHSADDERLERTLAEMVCYVLGGPCHYTGRDMTAAHKDMGVQRYQQNAQIEDLQKAMAEEQVPVWAQNRLLAKLAPLERVTVTR
jgi:hemoglobin